MSRGQRLALLGLAAVVAVAAVVFLRPGGGSEQTQQQQTGAGRASAPPPGETEPRPARRRPEVTEIRVRDGRPVGGVEQITVKSGDTVRLAVESNREDQLHVHGYDRYVDLRPGRTARVRFPARLEGVFEIESHTSGAEVAELRVEP